jgi:hypothetical protein
MNLFIKKIQQKIFWFVENSYSPKKISNWGWGNSYNDIYILKLLLSSSRDQSLNGNLLNFK